MKNFSLFIVLLIQPVLVQAADLLNLETRPGVTLKVYINKHEQPQASVILFAGGKGKLDLGDAFGDATIGKGTNFLVRSRKEFALNGFTVAIVDAPSDKQGKRGMLGGFRNSEEHVTDIQQVIAYLKKQADVPVWLVGTSRGTESATNVALYSNPKADGLILTSSMTVANNEGTAVTKMALGELTMPVMVVAHEEDACQKTPPEGGQEIMGMLTSSTRKTLKMFRGGDDPVSKPCQAKSYHGFLGIEEDVIDSIAAFIKAK